MIDQLRGFIESKLTQCAEKHDIYQMRLIKQEAFGACNFALTVTKDPRIVDMWEDEYDPVFESIIQEEAKNV